MSIGISVVKDSKLIAGLKKGAQYLVATDILFATLVLIGWQFNISMLKGPLPGMNPMNPTTAVAFVLCGFSFLLLVTDNVRIRRFGQWIAGLLLVAGFLRLMNAPIDQFLFTGKLKGDDGMVIRMASNTAFNLMLSGLALLMLHIETKGMRMPAHVIAVIIVLAALMALMTYIYRVEKLGDTLVKFPMAPHSAFCFLLLALSILMANPDRGIMKELTGPFSGSSVARYLIPAAIVVPILFGFLRLFFGWYRVLSTELVVSIFVLTIIVTFLALTWFIVVAQNKKDQLKLNADIALHAKEQQIHTIFNSGPDAQLVVNDAGIITLANSQCEVFFKYSSQELVGQTVELLIPDRHKASHLQHRQGFMRNPRTHTMGQRGVDLYARRKDGVEFAVEVSLTPMRLSDETVILTTIRDITQRREVENKMRFLATVASCIEDVIMITDLEFKITRWNAAAERILGWKEPEIVGQNTQVLNPQYPGTTREQALTAIREVGHWHGEVVATSKGGEPVNFIATFSSMKNETGISVGYLVLARDIMEQKKAQEQINFLARLVEDTDEAMYSVTPAFHIITWNKGAERLYGFKAEEVIGKSVYDIIRSPMTTEQRSRIRKKIMDQDQWQDQLEHFHKDGTLIHILASTSAIKNGVGEVIGYVSSGRNITEQKKSEELLKESEEKFNKAFQASPAGIIVTRLADSKIVEVNERFCEILSFGKDELLGRTADEAGIVLDQERRLEVYSTIKKLGYVNNVEMELKGKFGKTLHTLYSTQLLSLKSQPHALTVIYDISELKSAELKAKLLNQELEAFSYSVSHDLRAPLRSIDGYARILEEDYASLLDEEGKRVIKTITRNAIRMGRLIDDMLNLSRLGRLNVSLATLNMSDIVKKVIRELVEDQGYSKPSFQLTDLENVRGDLDMIIQVWMNYLGNAVKYSSGKDEPKIEIGSYRGDHEVTYYVKDNGAGFNNLYAHKLFGVFQRLHKQSEFEGTGVGLAIVKRIIEKHGGRVWAEGIPDEGATFYFALPKKITLK